MEHDLCLPVRAAGQCHVFSRLRRLFNFKVLDNKTVSAQRWAQNGCPQNWAAVRLRL